MIEDDRILCVDCRAYATQATELRLDDGTLYIARAGDCLAAATRRRLDVWQGYGPADVAITFLLPRPKGHWRTGRNAHLLRDDAPAFPTTKPDVDKLTRATLDALRDAGVYVDDAQVVHHDVRKAWATERPGAVITVSRAE